ncbi:MAG: ribonuclease H-like domain-containing protein, partial [Magnetococcales bacterium]|nr:ribonuclease H-like domain-containing protein [Magnetococcales bacterium]
MSGLVNKLKLLRKQRGIQSKQEEPTTLEAKTSLADRFHRSRPKTTQPASINKPTKISDQQIADLLNAEVVSEGLIEIKRTFPPSYKQGRFELGGALTQQLPTPIKGDINFNAQNAIFLDLETTGLTGGTGTLAFLTGLGFFHEGNFQVVLYLITSFAAEKSMLNAVAKTIKNQKTVVTFNGKSFDGPLLSTRFRLAGITDPLTNLDHIDLLHPARRAFRNVWPDCRLQSIEIKLMAFHRKNDLPGSEAPEVWLNLVRYGNTEKLRAVVKHNGLDILSLAALLPALTQTYKRPEQVGARIVDIARAYQKSNDQNTGFTLLEKQQYLLDRDGLMELAKQYRRQKNWQKAEAIWITLAQKEDVEAILSLAKYEEHINKNFATASNYINKLIKLSGPLPEHVYRRDRVQAKIIYTGK